MRQKMKYAPGTAFILTLMMGVISVSASAPAPPRITAQSAVVMCFDTGEILYEREAHHYRAPASMTKVLTAYIVYEEIALGNLTLETMLRVSPRAARISNSPTVPYGGVLGRALPLRAGSYISVETALIMMMPPSSNAAPVVVAEAISGSEEAFVERMHETALRLGMWIDFQNSHGAIRGETFTNTYSLAVLAREIVRKYPDILRVAAIPYIWHDGVRHNSTNRFFNNVAPFRVDGVDGIKTGTPSGGPSVMTTAYRNGRRIIAVNMYSTNNDTRYSDSRALLDFGFAEAERRAAERAAQQECPIRVFLDGVNIEFDADPRIINDRVMVPVRAILEAMDATVEWDGIRVITAVTAEGDTIILEIGGYTVGVNNNDFEIDIAAQIIEDRTFVPVRVISEATGRTVEWDGDARVVYVRS